MAFVTTTAFKQYRGITNTSGDALIGLLLTRAQAQVESYCDRTFVAPTTAATRYYDAVRDTSDDRRTLYLDDDLATIVTVVNGDGETVATTHYTPQPRHETPYYALRLTQNADSLWTYDSQPEDAIQVNGRWGYGTSAPADVQHAVIRLAAYLYAQKDVSTFDVTLIPGEGVMTVPQGLPRDVKELLEPYRRIR